LLEASENFTVNLSSAHPLVDASDTAIGTIADNETATASISANDASAAEAGSDPGQFTVSLGTVNDTGTPITVSYSIGGTATAGTDYTALTGSVQIAVGASSAPIDVTGIVDDALVEGGETVTVTLIGTDNGAVGVNATPTAVTIADNDTATVTVTANDAAAAEAGSDPGQFTVALGTTNNTGTPITVSYSIGGTATAGTDYTALMGSVQIAAGASAATIDVAGIVDDALVEGGETVAVTLLGTDNGAVGVDATPAAVTIADNDTAALTVGDVVVNEAAGTLTFVVTADNAVTGGFDVDYSFTDGSAASPADYVNAAGTVNFAGTAGESRNIVVTVNEDLLLEASETFTISLSTVHPLVDASDTATGTITDNETATVTVTANDAAAAEAGTDPGQFTVALGTTNNTGSPITVSYSIGGTAMADTDYTALTGSVQIAAGASAATIDVAGIVDDALAEGGETVTVTLTGTDNGAVGVDATPAAVTIADNDAATLTVGDVVVNEAAGTLTFVVALDNAVTGGFSVDYSFTDGSATGGVDYDNTVGTVNFVGTAGESRNIVVGIGNDALLESSETFTVNLSTVHPLVDASDTAMGTIADNETAQATGDHAGLGARHHRPVHGQLEQSQQHQHGLELQRRRHGDHGCGLHRVVGHGDDCGGGDRGDHRRGGPR